MLSRTFSCAVFGIQAEFVEVEVNIASGLPYYALVGLAETSVKESRERVKAALVNSGYRFPADRITVNLAPADVKKEGTGFDLPIALGILGATGIVPQEALSMYAVTGELSLDGRVKPVRGTLSMALAAGAKGFSGIIVPHGNGIEASVARGISVYPVKSLSQVVSFLRGETAMVPETTDLEQFGEEEYEKDFSEVLGQEHVKRALEITAAGGHNILMHGIPGSGKTMLASRFPTILPPMTYNESMETTRIYSMAGMLDKDKPVMMNRPFRAPHHTISDAGLSGGGHHPRPGEISLAHNGVLFLDEFPEFKRKVLEVLRQPLEDRVVTISRAAFSVTYPASFLLVAAMNPCACGYYGDAEHECTCSQTQVRRYRSRISGPLLDRIDMHVEVPAVSRKDLINGGEGESSREIRRRTWAARRIQDERFRRARIFCNAQMGSRHIRKYCPMDSACESLLGSAMDALGLSARALGRVIKISRTIADLEGAGSIKPHHISEAVQYRVLDRQGGRGGD